MSRIRAAGAPVVEKLEQRALMSVTPGAFTATGTSNSQITLTWDDRSSDETHFIIDRSTDGSNFRRIASVGTDTEMYTDSGLAAGTKYHYRIKAIGLSGNSNWARTNGFTLAPAAPAAPSTFVASGVSLSEINLTWVDNATDELNFLVERSTNGGSSYKRIASLPANSTSFTDSGLPAGTYYYRIKSANATMTSSWVRTSGTTATPTAPAAPSGFVAAGISTSQIELSWTDNATDETHFLLERSLDGSNFSRIASLPADTTTFTDSGLVLGTQYYYRIKAAHSTMTSSWVRASATTVTPAAPGTPSGFTASGTSVSQIQLNWTDNASDETHFLLERSTDGSNYDRIASLPADSQTFTDDNLVAGTTYYYRIKAANDTMTSSWDYTSAATATPTAPGTPSTFTATGTSTSQVHLTWTDNATDETHFLLERSTDGSNYDRIASLPADSQTFTDSSLAAGTTYYYRLKSANDVMTSGWVHTSAATEPPTSLPTVISEDFTTGSANFTVVDGSWSAVGGVYQATPGSGIQAHLNTRAIHMTSLAGDFTLDVNASVLGTTSEWNDFAVIFGYQDAENYYFFSNNESNDDFTSGLFKVSGGVVTELADVASGIAADTTYSVRVERVGGEIRAYRDGALVASATDATFTSGQVGLGTKGDSATFDNFVVTGTADTTPPPPLTAPTAPSALTAAATSSSRINLAWADNSTDESGFKVQRSSDGGTTWQQIATLAANVKSYAATGLGAATSYLFRVLAYNAAGDSGYSNTAAATTLPAPVAGARPGADNTGVLPGTTLTKRGSLTITVGGTAANPVVYENLDITGRIDVQAAYVVIRNVRVNSTGGSYSIKVHSGASDDPSKVLIENVECFGGGSVGVVGAGFTLRRANIYGTGADGVNIYRDAVIEDCWIHGLAVPGLHPDPHADGIQMTSGANVVIRRNFIDVPVDTGMASANSTIFLKTDFGTIDNILIEGNWLNGGNYTIYSRSTATYPAPTNVRVIDNRFGRDYRYGVFSFHGSVQQSGNIWDDTGTPVP